MKHHRPARAPLAIENFGKVLHTHLHKGMSFVGMKYGVGHFSAEVVRRMVFLVVVLVAAYDVFQWGYRLEKHHVQVGIPSAKFVNQSDAYGVTKVDSLQ